MMRISMAAALCLTLLCASAQAAERRQDKTFTVTPGGKLTVDAEGSSIEVSGADSNQVVVEIVVRGSQDVLDDMDLSAQQTADGVSVRAKRESSGWFNFWGGVRSSSVKVVVPRRYHLMLATSGGKIGVMQVQGDVAGRTSGGSVRVDRVQGPVRMTTSGGSMEVNDVTGNTDLRTSGGSISARAIKGDLRARTSGGRVMAESIRGNVELATSGGGVQAEAIDGSIRASSSGGDIRLDLVGANRGIVATTSGGGIVLRVPRSTAGNLDASTSGGSVSSELSVTTTEARKQRLVGAIHGGGPEIRVRTTGGSIRLQARD